MVSPRSTSDAGPTRAPSSRLAAGSTTPCGPRLAPASELHRVHAHDPIMEQMCLQHAPAVHGGRVAERHQVGLGQPVRLAPDAAADARAERPQPHGERRRADRGRSQPRHGDDLEERVGELVAPDERAPQRVVAGPEPADEQPLRRRGERARDAPRPPARRARRARPRPPRPHASSTACSTRSTSTPSPNVQITGTIRHSSTSARATRSRVGGSNVRASSDSPATRRSFTGGDPSQRRAGARVLGRRRQHRDEAALGHRAAGRDHPRVAQERALAHLAALDPQPAVAQLVGADEGVVGEERPVADGGQRRAA